MSRAVAKAAVLTRRSRVNLTVLTGLIDEARAQKLNLSRFFEDKLREALRDKKARQWQEENREAIAAYNARVEKYGPWNKDLISF